MRARKDRLVVMIVITLWVFLVSDNPIKLVLSIIFGATSSLVYSFIIKKEEKTLKLTSKSVLSQEKILLLTLIILLLTSLTTPVKDIYIENWNIIPLTNWIRFIIVSVYCMFIPGFIIIKQIDRRNKLLTQATLILSILLSIFFTSIFWYIIERISLPKNLVDPLFIISQFILLLFYMQHNKRKEKPKLDNLPKTLNSSKVLALGSIMVLSMSLVFLQQFIYIPFIRGDNWSYLGTSNSINKGAFTLKPTGKYCRYGPLFFYELFNLALFRLSGFPPVNSMMITSIIVASLIPVAFYIMSIQYTKKNKLSMLATFIYIAISGFGWIPFTRQKIDLSVKYYSPQNLLAILKNIQPKVLNDITQPQGLIPEGFKTYALSILAIIILLYLLKSKLSSKARVLLIATMVAFAFHYHIEEALIWTLTFMPAYIIFSNKKLNEIRKDIQAVAIGFLATFLIVLTYPTNFTTSFTLHYILVFLTLGSIFGYTFLKSRLNIRMLINKLRFLRSAVLFLVYYFYLLSIIILVFYGYENMYYGGLIVGLGFTFPWYYYPLSFGIVGILILIGLSMNFQKERSITFFLLTIISLLVFGRFVSFINVNFFFTGTKEWRILYRIIPIPASLFAGWSIYKLMCFFKNAILQLRFKFKNNYKIFQLPLRNISLFLFILLTILGIPSTILASEYWMVTDATSVGRIHVTHEDLEAANFIYQNISTISRMATMSSRSNAIVKLAGEPTAIPSNYPDLFTVTRPETVALLSSDVEYIYLDKETEAKFVKCGLISYLPLVFNNSRVAIYKLPYLEPPTDSNLGYIAPSHYNNETLLSYMLTALLNSSYEVIYDDIYDKSLLFLPTDLPLTERYVLTLDGVNNYVDLGDVLDIGSGVLTLELWFKTSVSGKLMSLVNKRRTGEPGYRIIIQGDTDRIGLELNDGTQIIGDYGQAHNDGKWHHVVAVYDRTNTLRLYVDGLLEVSRDISNMMGNVDTDCILTLGSQEGKNMFFNGSLSSVRIYNQSLSESEINYNYANPDKPVNSDLRLWLPLDEGAGSIAHDLSNYKNNGLVHGANWSFEQGLLSSVYHVEVSKIINWVKDGGTLVILGDTGVVYNLFGLQLGDYVEANEITIGDEVYSFNEIPPFRTLILPAEDEHMKVLSCFTLTYSNVSPFAIQKSFGKGNIIYFYIDPLKSIVSAQQHKLFIANQMALVIKDSLKKTDLYISSSSASSARFPLEKRWIGRYTAYGEIDFAAEGNITICSTISGSYLLQYPLIADVILTNSTQTKINLQNVTINSLNVIGQAKLKIQSSTCEVANKKTFSIPTYINFKFENCILKIRPFNSSRLEIQIDEEPFFIDNGEIIIRLDSASFFVKKPSINVNGYISFAKISLPFIEGVWTRNVKLVGNVSFYIDYNDEKYFFSDEIKGIYSTETLSRYPKIKDNIPWKDIVTSPFHLLTFLFLASIFYYLRRGRQLIVSTMFSPTK